MRKFLFSLLLASVAATPAIADPNDHQDRDNGRAAHEQRAQARDEARGDRGDRGGNRPAFAGAQRGQQFQGPQARDVVQRPQFEGRRNAYAGQGGFEQQRQAYAQQQQAYAEQHQQRERNWQGQRYQGQQYEGQRYDGQRYEGQRYDGQAYQGQRYQGYGQRMRSDGHHDRANWDRNWRNNNRYDWRNYRERHRSAFHLGLYVDPFGWGYQSFNIGYRMYPAYYGNQYWIDPAMYDLPYPPPGAAWIRYWNDAVLVDTYSGTVLDVIPGFFW
jgi:Ni/Co efflux regulator RcnB